MKAGADWLTVHAEACATSTVPFSTSSPRSRPGTLNRMPRSVLDYVLEELDMVLVRASIPGSVDRA